MTKKLEKYDYVKDPQGRNGEALYGLDSQTSNINPEEFAKLYPDKRTFRQWLAAKWKAFVLAVKKWNLRNDYGILETELTMQEIAFQDYLDRLRILDERHSKLYAE